MGREAKKGKEQKEEKEKKHQGLGSALLDLNPSTTLGISHCSVGNSPRTRDTPPYLTRTLPSTTRLVPNLSKTGAKPDTVSTPAPEPGAHPKDVHPKG